MPYNGSGVFTRLYSWINDAAANIKIRADRMDNEMNGFATGLSTCITKDGQTTVTADLPMAGFRHTGVGNANARTQYASFAQLQDGNAAWVSAGGTANAITATYPIPITALVDGQMCFVRTTSANTSTTPTFSPSSLPPRTIVKNGGQALLAGDTIGDLILRYDLTNTRWELLNPKSGSVFLDNAFRVVNNIDNSKYITYDISGASASSVGTFVCWMTSSRNWTLPDATTTLAGLGINQTYTRAQRGAPVSLTQATTIAVDLSLGNHFFTTMTGNRTLGNPTNMVAGQSGTIEIIQDGTGNRTLAYGADWLFAGGTDPVLSTAAGAIDVLCYQVNQAGTKVYASLLKGFA